MGDTFEVREFPEKSWSISKMKILDNCFREYYYTYYGSHNGWLWESTEEQKVSWRLKKLTNIWLMFGDKLHRQIKETINDSCGIIDRNHLKDLMRANLNIGVKESIIKYRKGSWDEYPKGEMLQEYYYGKKLDDRTVADIKERIELCVDGFLGSTTYKEIVKERCKILEVDEGNFDYIVVNGVKVYALIDTLYIDKDGYYIISDWKRGRFGEHDREQLLVYVLYVMERYRVPLERIKGRIEYLLTCEEAEYTFNNEDIILINNRIEKDLNVIDAFLVDKSLNKPREKDYFLMCDNIKKCKKCKFRRLCFDLEREELI